MPKPKSLSEEYDAAKVRIGGDPNRDKLAIPDVPVVTEQQKQEILKEAAEWSKKFNVMQGEFSPTVPRWPEPSTTATLPVNVPDPINPSHYTNHPSGVDCADVTEHFSFCIGNVIKYVWRAGLKSREVLEDLRKARWYLDREIARLEKAAKK